MKILFVHPGAEFSIWDVGQGLRAALVSAGHEISDYYLTRRMLYHAKAMEAGGADVSARNIAGISKQASETVIVEALYHRADLIVIVSGLNFNPIGLWLLDQMRSPRIPVALLLTESPYEDLQQAEWASAYPQAVIFTNERVSARRMGWTYLPHAYNPEVHKPTTSLQAPCDVMMIATGWPERQRLLEQVDWSGIHLRLIGPWPYMPEGHPLQAFHEDYCVQNAGVPEMLASAKIALNFFRHDPEAESLGPRSYELAACGVFQISDPRRELTEVFGKTVPTFTSPKELEDLIRYYLCHDDERRAMADDARGLVQGHTFKARAALLEATVMATVDRAAALTT